MKLEATTRGVEKITLVEEEVFTLTLDQDELNALRSLALTTKWGDKYGDALLEATSKHAVGALYARYEDGSTAIGDLILDVAE